VRAEWKDRTYSAEEVTDEDDHDTLAPAIGAVQGLE
jgi:hypothetical protein